MTLAEAREGRRPKINTGSTTKPKNTTARGRGSSSLLQGLLSQQGTQDITAPATAVGEGSLEQSVVDTAMGALGLTPGRKRTREGDVNTDKEAIGSKKAKTAGRDERNEASTRAKLAREEQLRRRLWFRDREEAGEKHAGWLAEQEEKKVEEEQRKAEGKNQPGQTDEQKERLERKREKEEEMGKKEEEGRKKGEGQDRKKKEEARNKNEKDAEKNSPPPTASASAMLKALARKSRESATNPPPPPSPATTPPITTTAVENVVEAGSVVGTAGNSSAVFDDSRQGDAKFDLGEFM